jgi:hypothetical protein
MRHPAATRVTAGLVRREISCDDRAHSGWPAAASVMVVCNCRVVQLRCRPASRKSRFQQRAAKDLARAVPVHDRGHLRIGDSARPSEDALRPFSPLGWNCPRHRPQASVAKTACKDSRTRRSPPPFVAATMPAMGGSEMPPPPNCDSHKSPRSAMDSQTAPPTTI